MRVNIGCGPVQPEGWVNVDPVATWGDETRDLHAITTGPLEDDWTEWAQACGLVDGAVAHHVLQMVSWPYLVPWLEAVRAILAPGAALRVSVPDFPGAYQAALDGDRDWFPIADEIEQSIDGKLVCYLTQCGATRSLFTGPWLEDLFRRAGLVGVRTMPAGETHGQSWITELDWTPDRSSESIYVEGRRP